MEVGRHTRSLNFQLSKELSTLFFLIKDYPYLQAFHFLETTPLLCILDDFLEELDAIFLKHETRSADPPQDEGRGKMSEVVRDVDGEYMELLEITAATIFSLFVFVQLIFEGSIYSLDSLWISLIAKWVHTCDTARPRAMEPNVPLGRH